MEDTEFKLSPNSRSEFEFLSVVSWRRRPCLRGAMIKYLRTLISVGRSINAIN